MIHIASPDYCHYREPNKHHEKAGKLSKFIHLGKKERHNHTGSQFQKLHFYRHRHCEKQAQLPGGGEETNANPHLFDCIFGIIWHDEEDFSIPELCHYSLLLPALQTQRRKKRLQLQANNYKQAYHPCETNSCQQPWQQISAKCFK